MKPRKLGELILFFRSFHLAFQQRLFLTHATQKGQMQQMSPNPTFFLTFLNSFLFFSSFSVLITPFPIQTPLFFFLLSFSFSVFCLLIFSFSSRSPWQNHMFLFLLFLFLSFILSFFRFHHFLFIFLRLFVEKVSAVWIARFLRMKREKKSVKFLSN